MERIVALTARNLDECAFLFMQAFSGEPWCEDWTLGAARERLREILGTPGAVGLACVDEKVIGVVAGYWERSIRGSGFYLKEMCVDSEWQHQGIGIRLLRQLEYRLKQSGVEHVYLLTRRNGPAEAFYAASGFRTSERTALMARNLWLCRT